MRDLLRPVVSFSRGIICGAMGGKVRENLASLDLFFLDGVAGVIVELRPAEDRASLSRDTVNASFLFQSMRFAFIVCACSVPTDWMWTLLQVDNGMVKWWFHDHSFVGGVYAGWESWKVITRNRPIENRLKKKEVFAIAHFSLTIGELQALRSRTWSAFSNKHTFRYTLPPSMIV